ncbi:MAG: hypothetical protein GX958_01680 [Desulfitobacterium sp.]|nr:hypothetical protein [Desulfitobacterium sp.]
MKKFKSLAAVIALGAALVLSGCGGNNATPATAVGDQDSNATQGKYEDGIYFAMEDEYAGSGWKNMVTIEVKDGKIADVEWNAANKAGGPDKITFSKSGQYGMKAGGAAAEWHEQSAKVEEYLIQTQDPEEINFINDDGNTDDIAGVTIKVHYFFDLAKKALDAGPVGKGKYQDGAYYAADAVPAKNGWKYFVSMTVVNGNIVAVDWNAVDLEGRLKDTLSEEGEYALAPGNQGEWHEQGQKAEAYLIETQDPSAITFNDTGTKTDDIAGVSISVDSLVNLAQEALNNGPIPEGSYKDGYYYAAGDEFSNGWKYIVNVAVKNGSIAGVGWNAISEEADASHKKWQAQEGEYALAPGNQGEWHEQAAKAEAYLIETQDPTKITYNDSGTKTDDIAGVSISVDTLFDLAAKALEEAK